MSRDDGRPCRGTRASRALVYGGWLVGLMGLLLVEPATGAADHAPAPLVRAASRAGCRIAEPSADLTSTWVTEREAGMAHAGWCARRGGRVYDLVVTTVSPSHAWARCPALIALGVDRPFPRLRATMLPRDLPYPMQLSQFWYLQGDDYLTAPEPPVRASGVPAGPALEIGDGDAGQILLCFANSWIMGGYH